MNLYRNCGLVAFIVKLFVLGDSSFESKFQKLIGVVSSGACHHLYMDLGSNIGIQIRKLYQPEYYKRAPILRHYWKVFGSQRNSVCAIGFEANAAHTNRLNMVEKAYKDAGYRCTIFTETAVSNVDGNITFHTDGEALPMMHQWGASLEFSPVIHTHGTNVTVQAIDFNKFFLKIFHFWTLSNNYSPKKSKIMVKVDVEGSEHELLPHLLAGGSLCKMNLIISEWHNVPHKGKSIEPHLRAVISRLRDCHIDMINLDDESYGQGNDTAPFPPPIHIRI